MWLGYLGNYLVGMVVASRELLPIRTLLGIREDILEGQLVV